MKMRIRPSGSFLRYSWDVEGRYSSGPSSGESFTSPQSCQSIIAMGMLACNYDAWGSDTVTGTHVAYQSSGGTLVKRVVIRHRTGLSQIIGITGELPEDWEAPMEIPSHLGPCALVINKPTYLVYKEKSYETEPSDRLGTAGDDAAGVCPE